MPVLWDKWQGTIVSNESAEIIRMLNSAFDGVGARPADFYPLALRQEIDAVNERVYRTVNNGVYKAGFATAQAAYEHAYTALFETLDWLDERLEAPALPRGRYADRAPIGGCSRPWCGSMRSITATSNATNTASPITRTCRTICASCTNIPM